MLAPSDALNLALMTDVPIHVASSLIDDQAAFAHDEWREYPTGTSDIATEARDHQHSWATWAQARLQRDE